MARKKIMRPVPVSKSFGLCDGKSFRSLIELAVILDEMNDEVFYHHVTNDKNDFAIWIHDSVKAEKLSSLISKIRDRKKMTYEIMRFVVRNV